MRTVFVFLFFCFFVAGRAHALSWDESCQPFTDGCLFVLATKELSTLETVKDPTAFYHLAFHAGRLGFKSIPGDSLKFVSKKNRRSAEKLLELGRSVSRDETGLNLNKPITSAEQILVAEYVLVNQIWDIPQEDIISILEASDIPPSVQGRILAQVLVSNLNRGEARLADGRLKRFISHLENLPGSSVGLSSMAIELAVNGYIREAREIVENEITLEYFAFSQDVLLYIHAVQSVLEGDTLRSISLASAIQSQTLRLESFAQLFAITRDQFIGQQFLSGLYDFNQPLSSIERFYLVLFTLASM